MKNRTHFDKFNRINTHSRSILIRNRHLRPASLGARLLGLALSLAALMLALPAWASSNVPYLDSNGAPQIAPSATDLTGNETTLTSGWYLASGSLSYANTLTISGDVHLILADSSDLTVNGSTNNDTGIGDAGIDVSTGNSLTVYAQSTGSGMGRLMATGGPSGAGIGGGGGALVGGAGGATTINGGAITATGSSGSSGIGGGGGGRSSGLSGASAGGTGGIIMINGGKITANGGSTGIGGGGCLAGTIVPPSFFAITCGGGGGAGGVITITGGTITATGDYGAGIGGGAAGGIITISGGGGAGGDITITGGTVTATGGYGAGIGGGGDGGTGGIITIGGDTVTATGSSGSAGIGGGSSGAGGYIMIGGGAITANGGLGSVGIGDNSGLCGALTCNILINGETTRVTAKSGGNGAQDIGSSVSNTADNVFVALPLGNLTLSIPSTTAVNNVLFTANPASTGVVTAVVPVLGASIDLLTGLDTTGKTLSIITTAGADSVSFALDGNGNSQTGIELMTPGAKVAFGEATNPPPPLAPQALTGDWYDPVHDGSGFNALMTGSGLSLYYYGWDSNGNRLWLVSDVGPTSIVPGTSYTLNMNQTNSGGFQTPAGPSSFTVWGALAINFSADGATAVATLSGQDGRVNFSLQKLAGMTSAPSVTGAWYDPAYSGSGFNVLTTAQGLSLYYYGWDSSGRRLWLLSDLGPTTITPGSSITLKMNQTNGGYFVIPATPSTLTQWGTLQLDFSSCTQANATLSGNDGKVTLSLQMLAGVLNLPPGC